MTGYSARRLARQLRPLGLELVRPDGSRRQYGPADGATLSGPATELLLYMSGRRAAHVTLGGSPEAVAAVERAKMAV